MTLGTITAQFAPLFGRKRKGRRRRRADSGYVRESRGDWQDRSTWYADWHGRKRNRPPGLLRAFFALRHRD